MEYRDTASERAVIEALLVPCGTGVPGPSNSPSRVAGSGMSASGKPAVAGPELVGSSEPSGALEL